MELRRKVILLYQSSERMYEALKLDMDARWWKFMRREARLHLRRILELLWILYMKKKDVEAGDLIYRFPHLFKD